MRNKREYNQDIMNEKIRAKEVRLIDETGENVGIVLTAKALEQAENNDLDLVIISQGSTPPVAKIMDYGKFRFEQQKKKKENIKNQKKTTIKLLRLSPTIDKHDLEMKVNQARKFLEKGNKVQFALRFRGRMITHNEFGVQVINEAITMLEDVCEVEQKPKMDGRQMFALVAPKKK